MASSESTQKKFKCLDCVGGLTGEYRLINEKCTNICTINAGIDCHFETGSTNCICNSCSSGYYNLNGKCYLCQYKTKYITGGTYYYYYCPGVNHNKEKIMLNVIVVMY